jgi:hypothetical protein
MQVLMVRNTVVVLPGQSAAPVDAGTIIELDAPQAVMLMACGKATAVIAPQGDVLRADDPTATHAEKRRRK